MRSFLAVLGKYVTKIEVVVLFLVMMSGLDGRVSEIL